MAIKTDWYYIQGTTKNPDHIFSNVYISICYIFTLLNCICHILIKITDYR